MLNLYKNQATIVKIYTEYDKKMWQQSTQCGLNVVNGLNSKFYASDNKIITLIKTTADLEALIISTLFTAQFVIDTFTQIGLSYVAIDCRASDANENAFCLFYENNVIFVDHLWHL